MLDRENVIKPLVGTPKQHMQVSSSNSTTGTAKMLFHATAVAATVTVWRCNFHFLQVAMPRHSRFGNAAQAFFWSWYDFFTVDAFPNAAAWAVFEAIGWQMVLLQIFVTIETVRVGRSLSRAVWYFIFSMGAALAIATPAFFANSIRELRQPATSRPVWIKGVWLTLLALSIYLMDASDTWTQAHWVQTAPGPIRAWWDKVSANWASTSIALDYVWTSFAMGLFMIFMARHHDWGSISRSLIGRGISGLCVAGALWAMGRYGIPLGLPSAMFAAFSLAREWL